MFHLFSLSDIKRSTLSCFCLSCGGSTHLVSLLSVQCNRLLHNFTQLTIRARASTCSIFCLSAFFSEMKAAAVQVRFCSVCCLGLTSLPALLPISQVSTHDVLPNSVLLCQVAGLVCACCPKCHVVHCFFSSAVPNPGAFVVFTRKFWRGVGSSSHALAHPCGFCAKPQILQKHHHLLTPPQRSM